MKAKIIAFFVVLMSVVSALWARDRAKLKTIKVVSQERQKRAVRASEAAEQETKRSVEDAKKKADSGDLSSLNDN